MKTNNQAVRKFRFGVTLGLGACLVAVAQACPKLGDQFVAATVDSNADGVPDVIVKGRVIPIVVDVDDMSMIVIQPSTSPFLVESSGGTYGARAITTQAASAYAAPEGQYNVMPINVTGSTCMSLLLQGKSSSQPSFLVNFASNGQPTGVQGLGASTVGYPIATYTLNRKDLNADGRDDVEVVEGRAVRGVLTGRSDGTLGDDPKTSALAVWRSFLAAASRSDDAGATQHLSDLAKTAFGPTLTTTASKLPVMASAVVDFEATTLTDRLVSITTVVQVAGAYQFFEAHVVRANSGWRIDSF